MPQGVPHLVGGLVRGTVGWLVGWGLGVGPCTAIIHLSHSPPPGGGERCTQPPHKTNDHRCISAHTYDDLDVPMEAEEARDHEHEPPVPLILVVRHHDARRDACVCGGRQWT